jgi:hypothetical protein
MTLRFAISAAACALACLPALARADTPAPSILSRPHTVALLELGMIALPTAPISPAHRGGDLPFGPWSKFGKGDATIQTGIHVVFRATPDFAFGAGVLFGPSPTQDDEYGGLSGLSRSHSRNYFTIGGDARYYPLRSRWVEGWLGLSAGGVVIADRFDTNAGEDVPKILGYKEVTVSTEGLSVGVQLGADWMFADRWVAGLTVRTDRWILPNSPACSVIGDCATLQGIVEVFQLGLTIGYRIPL